MEVEEKEEQGMGGKRLCRRGGVGVVVVLAVAPTPTELETERREDIKAEAWRHEDKETRHLAVVERFVTALLTGLMVCMESAKEPMVFSREFRWLSRWLG